jgi:hypothetical protein
MLWFEISPHGNLGRCLSPNIQGLLANQDSYSAPTQVSSRHPLVRVHTGASRATQHACEHPGPASHEQPPGCAGSCASKSARRGVVCAKHHGVHAHTAFHVAQHLAVGEFFRTRPGARWAQMLGMPLARALFMVPKTTTAPAGVTARALFTFGHDARASVSTALLRRCRHY